MKSCYRNFENKSFYLIWNKYFFAAFIVVVDLRPNIVPSYLLVSLLNHGLVLNGRVNSFCKSCVVCIRNQAKRQVCINLVCWFRLTFGTSVATHWHLLVTWEATSTAKELKKSSVLLFQAAFCNARVANEGNSGKIFNGQRWLYYAFGRKTLDSSVTLLLFNSNVSRSQRLPFCHNQPSNYDDKTSFRGTRDMTIIAFLATKEISAKYYTLFFCQSS